MVSLLMSPYHKSYSNYHYIIHALLTLLLDHARILLFLLLLIKNHSYIIIVICNHVISI